MAHVDFGRRQAVITSIAGIAHEQRWSIVALLPGTHHGIDMLVWTMMHLPCCIAWASRWHWLLSRSFKLFIAWWGRLCLVMEGKARNFADVAVSLSWGLKDSGLVLAPTAQVLHALRGSWVDIVRFIMIGVSVVRFIYNRTLTLMLHWRGHWVGVFSAGVGWYWPATRLKLTEFGQVRSHHAWFILITIQTCMVI